MKIYIAYGLLVCSLFFMAGKKGMFPSSMFQSHRWGGPGHGMYHK